MSIPFMSPLSPAPNRQTSSRTQFAIDVDRRLSEENRLTVEANALAEWMNSQGLAVNLAAADSKAQKEAAQAAAQASGQSAGAANQAKLDAEYWRNRAAEAGLAAEVSQESAAGSATTAGQQADRATTQANRADAAADRAEAIVGPVGSVVSKNVVTGPLDVTPDRVPLVGWLGNGGQSPAYVGDLNDLQFNVRVYANGASHGPSGAFYGWVEHSSITPGQYAFQYAYGAGGGRWFRAQNAGIWDAQWFVDFSSRNLYDIGPDLATAKQRLGIGAGDAAINLGDVAAGNVTLVADLSAAKIFKANVIQGTGVLTLNFTNVSASETEVSTWHIQLVRGGLKTLAFQRDGVAFTPVWAAGVPPEISSSANTRSVLMFEKWPGQNNIYAMLVDAGAL